MDNDDILGERVMPSTIVKESILGKKLKMLATGAYTNKDLNNIIGKCFNIAEDIIALEITTYPEGCDIGTISRKVQFHIGPQNWSYEIMSEDWDD